MQFYYGEKLPLRLLDETNFWKHQEKEHTVVIREVVPALENDYVVALKKWEEAFAQTEAVTVRMIENVIRAKDMVNPKTYDEIIELVKFANDQSKQFILLLNDILKNSNAVVNNTVAITVIEHIRRESEYYIGITNAILND